ncbi:hypothetical protein MJ561_25205 [Klebsiella pneumoniae]|nr:hypothetical protein MJ561_25205 [Klebsiella pneumoniae]
MATPIFLRNLREVAKAAITLIEQPKTTLRRTAGYRTGSGFPTPRRKIITSRAEIRKNLGTGAARVPHTRCG